jgi:hypothetical protein
VKVGSVVASAELHERAAPKTVASLWSMLPIEDRTIPTQWSGRAWRTEADYPVMPNGPDPENVADHLAAGDVIFYPRAQKIGIAYGEARWLGPFCLPRDVSLIGHIDENLDAFVDECMKIIYEGPLTVQIERAD